MHAQLRRPLFHSTAPARATVLGKDRDAALLELLGDLSNTHALVLGEGALEFMCALIRRGCTAATVMRWNENAEIKTAELVVAPNVASTEAVQQTLWQARRAMVPNGLIVLRVQNDRTGWLAFSAAQLLRKQGFASIRVRQLPDQILLTATRPLFGATLHS